MKTLKTKAVMQRRAYNGVLRLGLSFGTFGKPEMTSNLMTMLSIAIKLLLKAKPFQKKYIELLISIMTELIAVTQD